jgi:hypothetical protein
MFRTNISTVLALQDAAHDLLGQIQTELYLHFISHTQIKNYQDFLNFLAIKYADLNITLADFNFLEHCLLFKANCLPLHGSIKNIIDMQLSAASDTTLNLSLGIPDDIFYSITDPGNHYDIGEDDKDSIAYYHLKQLPNLLVFNLNDLQANFVMLMPDDRQNRQVNHQYNLILNLHATIITFITNPIYIALQLINYENNYNNNLKVFAIALTHLINSLESFKGLNKGLPDQIIADIEQQLIELRQKSINRIDPIAALHQLSINDTAMEEDTTEANILIDEEMDDFATESTRTPTLFSRPRSGAERQEEQPAPHNNHPQTNLP